MADKMKENVVSVRFDPSEKKQLDKEAAALGLGLGSYLRMLIVTHPDRGSQSPSKAFIQRAFSAGKN